MRKLNPYTDQVGRGRKKANISKAFANERRFTSPAQVLKIIVRNMINNQNAPTSISCDGKIWSRGQYGGCWLEPGKTFKR